VAEAAGWKRPFEVDFDGAIGLQSAGKSDQEAVARNDITAGISSSLLG
jgi:hypothetical protein